MMNWELSDELKPGAVGISDVESLLERLESMRVELSKAKKRRAQLTESRYRSFFIAGNAALADNATTEELVKGSRSAFDLGNRIAPIVHEMAVTPPENPEAYGAGRKAMIARFYIALAYAADLSHLVHDGLKVGSDSDEATFAVVHCIQAEELILGRKDIRVARARKAASVKARRSDAEEKTLALRVLTERTEKWRDREDAVRAVASAIQLHPSSSPDRDWEGVARRWLSRAGPLRSALLARL